MRHAAYKYLASKYVGQEYSCLRNCLHNAKDVRAVPQSNPDFQFYGFEDRWAYRSILVVFSNKALLFFQSTSLYDGDRSRRTTPRLHSCPALQWNGDWSVSYVPGLSHHTRQDLLPESPSEPTYPPCNQPTVWSYIGRAGRARRAAVICLRAVEPPPIVLVNYP